MPTSEGAHIVWNLDQLTTKVDIINFFPASLFIPVKITWINTIQHKTFLTWPVINEADVKKYLKTSFATVKGKINCKGNNIWSTRASDDHDYDMTPLPDLKSNDMLVDSSLTVDTEGTVYIDLNGKFPIMILVRNMYVMVLYRYDTNGRISALCKIELMLRHSVFKNTCISIQRNIIINLS